MNKGKQTTQTLDHAAAKSLSSFPGRLYDCLAAAEAEGMEHIISWQLHGRSFRVHKPNAFVAVIMPRFFLQKTFSSFQRQLNQYGFSRRKDGIDEGSYHHPSFTKQEPALVQQMSRSKTNGRSVDKRRDEATEQPQEQEQPGIEDGKEWDEDDDQDSSKSSSTDNGDDQKMLVTPVVSPSNSPRHHTSESEPSHGDGSTDTEGDEHTEASTPTLLFESSQLKTCEVMGWDPSELEPTPLPDCGCKGYMFTLVDPELNMYTLQLQRQ